MPYIRKPNYIYTQLIGEQHKKRIYWNPHYCWSNNSKQLLSRKITTLKPIGIACQSEPLRKGEHRQYSIFRNSIRRRRVNNMDCDPLLKEDSPQSRDVPSIKWSGMGLSGRKILQPSSWFLPHIVLPIFSFILRSFHSSTSSVFLQRWNFSLSILLGLYWECRYTESLQRRRGTGSRW